MLSSLLLLTQRMEKFKTGFLMLKTEKIKQELWYALLKAMAALPLQMQLGSVYTGNLYKKLVGQTWNVKLNMWSYVPAEQKKGKKGKDKTSLFIHEMLNIRYAALEQTDGC